MFDRLRKFFKKKDNIDGVNNDNQRNNWRRRLNPVQFYSNPGTFEYSENSEAVDNTDLVLCKICNKNYHEAMYTMCIPCWEKENRKARAKRNEEAKNSRIKKQDFR
jgi:hypothetical protein